MLFGGNKGDLLEEQDPVFTRQTFTFDVATATWANRTPLGMPPNQSEFTAAADANGNILAVGGLGAVGGPPFPGLTRFFDGVEWSALFLNPAPAIDRVAGQRLGALSSAAAPDVSMVLVRLRRHHVALHPARQRVRPRGAWRRPPRPTARRCSRSTGELFMAGVQPPVFGEPSHTFGYDGSTWFLVDDVLGPPPPTRTCASPSAPATPSRGCPRTRAPGASTAPTGRCSLKIDLTGPQLRENSIATTSRNTVIMFGGSDIKLGFETNETGSTTAPRGASSMSRSCRRRASCITSCARATGSTSSAARSPGLGTIGDRWVFDEAAHRPAHLLKVAFAAAGAGDVDIDSLLIEASLGGRGPAGDGAALLLWNGERYVEVGAVSAGVDAPAAAAIEVEDPALLRAARASIDGALFLAATPASGGTSGSALETAVILDSIAVTVRCTRAE